LSQALFLARLVDQIISRQHSQVSVSPKASLESLPEAAVGKITMKQERNYSKPRELSRRSKIRAKSKRKT